MILTEWYGWVEEPWEMCIWCGERLAVSKVHGALIRHSNCINARRSPQQVADMIKDRESNPHKRRRIGSRPNEKDRISQAGDGAQPEAES